jgi:protein SCO1/2
VASVSLATPRPRLRPAAYARAERRGRVAGVLILLLIATPARADAVAEADVIEKLGERVPLDLAFTGDVPFRQLFHQDKPVILTLVYYRCPTLCTLALGGLTGSLRRTGLKLGDDYLAATVSIDPSEPTALARERQRGHLQALGLPEKARSWPFYVGEAESIRALADAVGFRYVRDASSGEFAHAAVTVVLSPDGKVTRYLYGLEHPPRDLRFTLIEAADGKVGTTFDRVLLKCFRYDPASRRYAPYVRAYFQVGGLLIFSALAVTLARFWRRELKKGTAP